MSGDRFCLLTNMHLYVILKAGIAKNSTQRSNKMKKALKTTLIVLASLALIFGAFAIVNQIVDFVFNIYVIILSFVLKFVNTKKEKKKLVKFIFD